MSERGTERKDGVLEGRVGKRQAADEVNSGSRVDMLRWLLLGLLLLLGIVFNDYLRGISLNLCLLAWCAILSGCGWLFLGTAVGQEFKRFVALACQEMAQVVWPSRDEVTRTTAMVAVIVFAVSFVLWFIDLILVRVLGFFIG